jgi:2'-5' RNA ligase
MTKAVGRLPSFPMTIEGLGAFPKIKNPRILWVGIQKGAEELRQLTIKLEESLEHLGFKKEERDFSPHITLGRLNSYESKLSLTEALEKPSDLPPLEQKVHQVVLFKSTLAPQGSLYEPLISVDLA